MNRSAMPRGRSKTTASTSSPALAAAAARAKAAKSARPVKNSASMASVVTAATGRSPNPNRPKGVQTPGQKSNGAGMRANWVPDHRAQNCMVCQREFGWTRRRHHCRHCGSVVCSACSPHKIALPYVAFQTRVRVCEPCFDSLKNEKRGKRRMPRSGVRQVEIKNDGSKPDDRLSLPTLSPWLYLFKPLTREGKKVGIGRIYVRVIEAVNLPIMDMFTSDPYCVISTGPFFSHRHKLVEALARLGMAQAAARRRSLLQRQTAFGTSKRMADKKSNAAVDDAVVMQKLAKQNPELRGVEASQFQHACTAVQKDRKTGAVWNEEFVMPVRGALDSVVVSLFDWDRVGDHQYVGHVHIPLSELSHQTRVQMWLPISMDDKVRAKRGAKSGAADGKWTGTSTPTKTPQRYKTMRSSGSSPVGAAASSGARARSSSAGAKADIKRLGGGDPVDDSNKLVQRPVRDREQSDDSDDEDSESDDEMDEPPPVTAVRIEVQYTFSKVGEFFSHFNPVKPPAAKARQFDVDLMYGEIMRLLGLLGPVFTLIYAVMNVLSWNDTFLSTTVLIMFVYLMLNTWMIPPVLILFLIRHMVWQYVLLRWRTTDKLDREPWQGVAFKDSAEKSKLLESMNPDGTATDDIVAVEDQKLANFGSALRFTLNSALDVAGLDDWLGTYQGIVTFLADTLQFIYRLFDWTWPGTSKAIFFVLIGCFLYSLFLPFQYIAMVVGVYVLTMWTVPIQFVMWVIFGVIHYINRPRVDPPSARKRWQQAREAVGAALGLMQKKDQ